MAGRSNKRDAKARIASYGKPPPMPIDEGHAMSAPSTKRSIAILKTSDDRVSISIQESDGQSRHMMAQIELSIQDAELLAGDIMKSVEAIRRRAR